MLSKEEQLCDAAEGGDIEKVKSLLKDETINVNWKDRGGFSALHLACWKGHRDIAELLLDHGAEMECLADPSKITPLMFACVYARVSTVKMLLDRGANANAQDKHGDTSLHWACRSLDGGTEEDRNKCVQDLLAYGADPKIKSKDSPTPLYLAKVTRLNKIVNVLIKHQQKQQVEDHRTELDVSSLHSKC